MTHQDFLDVAQATDVSTLKQRLVQFANRLGFERMALAAVVAPPGQAATFRMLENAPEAMKHITRDLDIARRDPVMQTLRHSSQPFTYDEAFYLRHGCADLYETTSAFGYRTGLAVAHHLPGHRHVLLGFDRNERLPQDEAQVLNLLGQLNLLASFTQETALRLMMAEAQAEGELPRLTAREREVLQWTLAGKSNWEVARIVSLSERTVKFHAANAMAKLGVTDRVQAAIRANALCLL